MEILDALSIAITALVTLVVATVIYGWQRSLEHTFLLKQQKREVFANYLGLVNQAYRAIYLSSSSRETSESRVISESLMDLSSQLSILPMYCEQGTYLNARRMFLFLSSLALKASSGEAKEQGDDFGVLVQKLSAPMANEVNRVLGVEKIFRVARPDWHYLSNEEIELAKLGASVPQKAKASFGSKTSR